MKAIAFLIPFFLLSHSVQAKDVDAKVQSNLCVHTKNNKSNHVLSLVNDYNVNLKRDFNKIHCKKTSKFEGGNLYQVAAHFNRMGMFDSFLDEHGMSINQLDKHGKTVLDWVDNRIAYYKGRGITHLFEKYKKLRFELVDTYEAKNAKDL